MRVAACYKGGSLETILAIALQVHLQELWSRLIGKLSMLHGDLFFNFFLFFSWNKVCFWFTRLWWSVPHLYLTPLDPTLYIRKSTKFNNELD